MTTEIAPIEHWYSVDADAVVNAFKTNREDGLTTAEVGERLQEYVPTRSKGNPLLPNWRSDGNR